MHGRGDPRLVAALIVAILDPGGFIVGEGMNERNEVSEAVSAAGYLRDSAGGSKHGMRLRLEAHQTDIRRSATDAGYEMLRW